jgi:hypothetical protein
MKPNYPTSTQLEEHFSIFMINLTHCLNNASFKNTLLFPSAQLPFENWINCLEDAGWDIHEYFKQHLLHRQKRQFYPDAILSTYAHESIFGKSRFDEKDSMADFLKKQINPNNPDYPRSETLLLSLKASSKNWLNVKLQTIEDKADMYDLGGLHFTFTIEWADLWIFPDQLAYLSCKVVLNAVQDSESTPSRKPGVGDLSAFNRWFRHTLYKGLFVYPENDPKNKCHWWQDIGYKQWLKNGNILWPPQQKGWQLPFFSHQDMSEKSWETLIQQNHYAKVLTAARIPDLPYENMEKAKELERDWQKYDVPEYRSYGSLYAVLVSELATFSDEGTAMGLQAYDSAQGRKWRYQPGYLKKLYHKNKIAVWAYWNGIALQDSCAFLAWDASMPVVKQAESYYYTLYVHICHLYFRLDDFAGKVIDYRLENTQQANQLLEEFHAFRNQYWFKDMTAGFVGAEVCQGMKKGMDVDPLFTRVSDEVKQMSTYLNAKQDKGWQFLISIALIFFYPLQMLWKKVYALWPGEILAIWNQYPFAVLLFIFLLVWGGIRLFKLRRFFISLRQRLAVWGYGQNFLKNR